MRALVLAAVVACAAIAQDSRPDPARRLHELVDQKIEALRAELHREIDLAFTEQSQSLGLMSRAASDEFRELHRLPEGCGLKIVYANPKGRAFHALGLLEGDVLLYVWNNLEKKPGTWIKSEGELDRFLGSVEFPCARLVRKGELVTSMGAWGYRAPMGENPTWFPSRMTRLSDSPAQETASQMVDRMWDEAVQKRLTNGLEAMRTDQTVSESQPVRK